MDKPDKTVRAKCAPVTRRPRTYPHPLPAQARGDELEHDERRSGRPEARIPRNPHHQAENPPPTPSAARRSPASKVSTFASLLIDSGANAKAVQEAMGHARIATTFDIYGHLLDGSRDELRERMHAYLADATGTLIEEDEAAPHHQGAGT